MKKSFFEKKIVAAVTLIVSAVLLTPVVGDCAYFFWEESLQSKVHLTAADMEDAYGASGQAHVTDEKIGDTEDSRAYYDADGGSVYYDTEDAQDDNASSHREMNEADATEVQPYDTEMSRSRLEETESESSKATKDISDVELEETADTYYIKINRVLNVTTVYIQDEDGEYTVPYKAFVCSTGKYNRTPLGTFALSTRYRWRMMVGGVFSQYATRVHGSILIHSVPYYRQNAATLETKQYNLLGEQASLGCIRMSCEDAKWVFDHCPEGTVVEIYEDAEDPGPLGKPEPITIDTSDERKGWDPTDPAEENPWNESTEADVG